MQSPDCNRVRELLEKHKNAGTDIAFVTLRNPDLGEGLNKTFFVDDTTFQCYLQTDNLPLFNIQNQASIFLLTALLDDIKTLDMNFKFWNMWVCIRNMVLD